MVKGMYRSLGYDFPADFGEYITLVSRASATLKDTSYEDDQEPDEKSEFSGYPGADIRFNLKRGLAAFKRSLESTYERSTADIEDELTALLYKSEKLTILARYITHIESCQALLTKNDEGYRHQLFTFSNLSDDKDLQQVNLGQKQFQDYYFWMDHFLVKMRSYLLYLQSSIQTTAQDEFPKPKSLAPKSDASSVDNPIAFFQDIVEWNGVRKLRNKFKPSEEDYYYIDIAYDEKTETRTTHEQDNETGEWQTTKKTFAQEYLEKVYFEFNRTKNFIDQKIDTCKTTDEVRLAIHLLTARLQYLLSKILVNKDAAKYETTEQSIKGLLRFVYEKYGPFAPPPDQTLKAILVRKERSQAIPKQITESITRSVKVFSYIGTRPDSFAILLHEGLLGARLIDPNTDVTQFRKAFNGEHQEHPLKIRWIDKGLNGLINKKTLIHLLNQLAEAKLISEDGDNRAFFQRITFVFADSDGQAIQNLKESSSSKTGRKRPSQSITAIDNIVAGLKKL